MIAAVTVMFVPAPAAQADGTTVVDPDTTNAWSVIAASSKNTQNIGRIWTDKSVFNDDYDFTGALNGTSVVKGTDSDFLVGLSAISSTSNLKSVVTNTTPLDIVLVLDVSGSMDNSIGEIETTTYQEVYDGRYTGLDMWRTYYVRSGNDYIAVTWKGNYYNGSWQDLSGNEYEPRTSRNDNNRNHVQFYQQITASESAGSKIDALKDAANGFAETFATMNDGITDTSKQHRISVVKFSGNESNQVGNNRYRDDGNTYNYSQVVSDLRSYTTQTVSDLESTINSLDPAGSTRADYGLSQAERVLNGGDSLTGAREGAQKVVIFFTDGEPNGFSGWDGTVAANAINNAHDMKQSGTLVYTIGVFEDANPSDTDSNFNRYMNAVSSNYPEAECADRWGQQTNDFNGLDLGDPVEGEDGEEAPQYYYSATNSVGLEQVFKDITESLPINQGSGSPIEEVEGAAGTPGYLTFTDTLGSFMEVTGVGTDNDKMYLAFADGLHEGTTDDGGKTWEFSGVVNKGQGVNTAYPEGADLSEIKVAVEKSNDLAKGDTITVQIPASLIPMRNYDVDTDNGTMTVSDTYPVRLFYGVSVKDAAIDALNNPQNANHDAVLAQTSADGKTIDFYSNSFVKDAAEGSTEASFTPSDGNKFYYYPVNTQLFIDEDCATPATHSNIGNYSKLYYKDSYWQLTGNGNEVEEVSTIGSITRSGNDWNVTYQGNNAYIAANTPRADRPATLVSNKGENVTGTASTVLTPTWVGNSVSQKLGNNGKLSVDAPGDLRIDKNVYWGNASDDTKTGKNNFKFTVHLYTVAEDGAQTNLTNKYDYAVYGTGETPVSTGTISDNGEITLKGGQYVVISDLPNGAQYTVTEQAANQNGFTTTDNSTGENAKTDNGIVEGTIVGGSQQTASFTNTYHATEVTLEGANQLVKVKKNLTGREWQDTDEFRFTMLPEGGAPEPESTDAVVVDDEDAAADYTVNMSNITFENPGTFTYVIEEDNDTNPIAGIDYSNETYAVTITVVDNGMGKLEIQSVQFTQRTDVDGNTPVEQPQITDNTVVFTNNYDADEATTNLNGTKDYTDNSGSNPNAANKFTFELKAIGGYATEGGSADNPTIDAANVPMPEGADANTHTITIGNNGTNPDGFAFQTIKYDGTHLNNTYIYEIREVIPQGATENSDGTWTLNGMTYDGTVHTVTVTVADEPNTQGEGVHIVATPSMQPADVQFTNVYDPEDYKLTGDEAIHGTKVLQGREIGDNETFYFQLKQTAGPETVLDNPETKTVTKNSGMDFTFSDLTFTKAGTYTFTVNEVANEQGDETTDGKGMTYSQNVAEVTIEVKDGGNGSLVLDGPIVYKNQDSDETAKAVFTNVYKASMKYGAEGKGGINVNKTMRGGRPMAAGEFQFTLTGEGPRGEVNEQFTNGAAAMDGTVTMAQLQSLTFDQDDAGKTFTFTVDEAEGSLDGVTYDQSQYSVDITVFDNGDGTMHTETTVTKTMNADGSETNEMVVDKANSDAQDYQVPTFGFTNSYEPTSITTSDDTETTLQVTKIVTGAPSPDGVNYSFTLTPADDNPAPVQGDTGAFIATTSGTIAANDSRTVSFGELTFTKAGTYTFTVKETAPQDRPGWTYDTADKTITVEVVGYDPETGEYDGQLHIANVTGNPVKVTNAYQPGTVIVGGEDAEDQIVVQKTVTGYATDTDFTFQLQPVDPDDLKWNNVKRVDSSWDGTATITEDFDANSSKTVTMGGLKFSAIGDYQFTVTEVGSADFNAQNGATRAGWTYDGHTATVTVSVTDDDFDGQLDATVSYDNTKATTDADKAVNNAAAFTNKYEAGPTTLTGSESFTGTKTIEGRNGIDGEKFGFTLKPGDAADGGSWDAVIFQPEGGDPAKFDTANATATMSKGNNTAGFSFDGTFTFSKAGTYTFNVTETSHNGKKLPKDGANGMIYDRHTGTITVKVTDDGKGNLHATAEAGTITEGDGENDMTFENAYQATPGRWGFADGELLGGHKYINDTTGGTYTLEANQFSFTMRAQAEGNPMPEGWDGTTVDDQGRGMMTVTNGTGNATDVSIYDFGWIEFTHADMAGATEVENKPGVFAKTFQYNIFETGTMPAGISRDNTAYTVTFTVTEDHNTGKITVATPTATKIVEGSGGAGDPADVTKLDFTNTYNPTSIEGHQNFFKTLVGRNWQQGDSFTFDVSMTATEADGSEWPAGAPLPSVKASDGYDFSEVKTNAAGNGLDYTVTINPSSQTGNTYRFDTGTITYEREGIYTWTVSEKQSTVDHVTSDGTVYTITVTVTDEGGVLKRSVQVTGGNYTDHDGDQTLDFTNVYKPNEVTTDDQGGIGNIQVTKKVEGNATSAAFNFKLTLENGDAANVLTNKDDPQSAFPADGITKATSGDFADGDTKAVDFGALTFTAEGDYTFKVVETDDAPANWTYANRDADAKTITIHVTDPDNGGQLVASYDKEAANNPTFTNSYKAEGTLDGDAEGAKNLMVTKTIDGRKFQKDDTFSFQLTADKNNPAGATLPENADGITIAYADGDDTASKTAAFGDITFTLPGTYTFHVSEKVPADADKLGGMTYSDEQYTVTVEVTDAPDGNGKLDAAITKIVNKAGAEVDGLAFTNTYKPGGTTDLPETGEGSIQLRKVLTGKAWDGDEFKFQLTAKGATTPDGSEIADVPMPDVAGKTISDKTGTENGNDYADFGFGPITYSQAGTYVYEVTEVPGDNAGISYDGHTATVTVSVVDNLHGGFTATASVENGTFTNAYKSELDYQAAGGLKIAKTFENADMREFGFTVKPADQASADKLGIDPAGEPLTTTPGATVGDDNASHATVSIGAGTDVTFTQADAGKTYTYTVQENAGSDAGVNYDGTVYTVTITTVDDGQGGIQVTTMVTDAAGNTQSYVYDNDDTTENQPAVIPFTNTYTATGELGGNGSTSIKATKTLTNRPMTDSEFTFNVTNAADPAGTVVATGTNAADGTVTFGAIGYSVGQMLTDATNGLAKKSVVDGKYAFTYQYTVAEDQASFDKGVTAIAGSFGITVTVTDNGDGTLGIAVAYPDGGDGLTFRNAYGEGEQGQATLNIAGEKKLDVQSGNNAPNIEGKYTFTLTGEDGAPMPGTTTATNDAAGNVTFGDVTYTMENVFGDTGNDGTATLSAQRTRTFTYTVTESGAVDGVANDPEASKTFTVTVTDNGDGTLSAVSDPAQGAKFSFTNTYSVKPTDSSLTGKGGIAITKKLTGRDLQDGEFSFELVDHNGQKVAEGTNDADGNVELGAVTFTEPGVYPYTIREVNTALASVDYDAAEHAVTATVTDNGDGTLSVTWKLDGDTPATFTNTYDPVDASVVIGASKVLDGRELKDGEFTFQLTGADESTPMPEDAKDGVSTATNAANGSIGFGTIVYDQAGTYKYTVSEVNDKQDGVTYDDTTYEVTVTVTDNTAEGRLEATVDYGDATALVFTNTYKKAEATIPKTGAAVILPSVIGFILLLGAGGMYASKRRKRS